MLRQRFILIVLLTQHQQQRTQMIYSILIEILQLLGVDLDGDSAKEQLQLFIFVIVLPVLH